MTKPIDSEEEYERRKELLEEHKEQEGKYWGRQFTTKPLTGLIDISGIADKVKDTIEDLTD